MQHNDMPRKTKDSGRHRNLVLVEKSTAGPMVESVDTGDLKSPGLFGCASSSLARTTTSSWHAFCELLPILTQEGLSSTDTALIAGLITEDQYLGLLDTPTEN